jgi:hypothetical protein
LIYHYRAYGLPCISNTPIEGFHPSPVPAQRSVSNITLDLVSVLPDWVAAARRLPSFTAYTESSSSEDADSRYTMRVFGSDEAFELSYADGTQFVIDGPTRRVWGVCPSGFGGDYLATYLRGPLMGFILRRRGVTALHASALNIRGCAVVLCGESQSGKSTIAASLALRGTPVLCEDVTPLRVGGNDYWVEPGYAQIGLWPDAVETLLGSADALPRLTSSWEKCFLPLDGHKAKFESTERPLGVIYLLAPHTNLESAPAIEQVGCREALLGLVQNTYMNWLLDRNQRAVEFDFLSRLVLCTPVRRIVSYRDPGRITTLCDIILADTHALQSDPHSTSFVSSR